MIFCINAGVVVIEFMKEAKIRKFIVRSIFFLNVGNKILRKENAQVNSNFFSKYFREKNI